MCLQDIIQLTRLIEAVSQVALPEKGRRHCERATVHLQWHNYCCGQTQPKGPGCMFVLLLRDVELDVMVSSTSADLSVKTTVMLHTHTLYDM